MWNAMTLDVTIPALGLLRREERNELVAGLNDAYPTREMLRVMVPRYLPVTSLDEITTAGSQPSAVLDVVTFAAALGRRPLVEFLEGVAAEREATELGRVVERLVPVLESRILALPRPLSARRVGIVFAWVPLMCAWLVRLMGVPLPALLVGVLVMLLAPLFVEMARRFARRSSLADWWLGPLCDDRRFIVVLVAMGTSLLSTFFVGVVEVRTRKDPRHAEVYRIHGGKAASSPSGAKDLTVAEPGWFRLPMLPTGQRVSVRVAGLPESSVRVMPWWRLIVKLPDGPPPPVLLLLPAKELTADLRNNDDIDLVVSVKGVPGSSRRLEGYHGQAVWVGNALPEVPREFRDQPVFAAWPEPLSLPESPLKLAPGQQILIELYLRAAPDQPQTLYLDPSNGPVTVEAGPADGSSHVQGVLLHD